MECLWGFIWLLSGADADARPPRGHPQRRPRFGLTADLHHPWKLVDHARRLDNLFHACAADMACNAAHPHLEATFTQLVNKLEAGPLTTTISDPGTGKDVNVVLDGGALVDWLRNQNYAVPLLR